MDDVLGEGFALCTIEDVSELERLYRLFSVTDPHSLGFGRDVAHRGVYSDLHVVRAWRICSTEQRAAYEAKKVRCCREVRQAERSHKMPQVWTKLDTTCEALRLDESINEKVLLHGTKPEVVLAIAQNGLNERFSDGHFGSGLYLAEDASKIDQYCTPDQEFASGSDSLAELHRSLYKSTDEHPGKVFYCFVVRAMLGFPVYTKDGETNCSNGDERIWATDFKRELAAIPGVSPPIPYHSLVVEAKEDPSYKLKRHREFITFSGDRILLEYLVAYKRV